MNARTKLFSVLGLSLAVLGTAAWAGDKDKDAKAAARDELEAERKAGIWTESVNYKHHEPKKAE